ncbi:unnamed protein product [Candida verbasci]|uniref:Uncharacterized protein n=1 Tax=Candida verbasci TaxID=1227364 RepID=A0A9W4XK26_9ASCO|nr:unnamed protein product [Candida verbasci]
MLGSDNEDNLLSKEERLEIAKKKLKEMKKKNKKSKTKTTESTDANQPEDIESKESTPLDTETKPETEKVEEKKPESIEEPKTEEKRPESIEEPKTEETKPETTESIIKDELEVEAKDELEPKPETKSDSSEIDRLNQTIKKLRDENTNLKLEIMDLKDRIRELETGPSTTRTSQPVYSQNIKPAKPIITKNEYATISQQNFSDFNSISTDNFRDKLMIWKHWQIDMTNWTGVGTSQKLAL